MLFIHWIYKNKVLLSCLAISIIYYCLYRCVAYRYALLVTSDPPRLRAGSIYACIIYINETDSEEVTLFYTMCLPSDSDCVGIRNDTYSSFLRSHRTVTSREILVLKLKQDCLHMEQKFQYPMSLPSLCSKCRSPSLAHYGLSCSRIADRLSRHACLDGIIRQTLSSIYVQGLVPTYVLVLLVMIEGDSKG